MTSFVADHITDVLAIPFQTCYMYHTGVLKSYKILYPPS